MLRCTKDLKHLHIFIPNALHLMTKAAGHVSRLITQSTRISIASENSYSSTTANGERPLIGIQAPVKLPQATRLYSRMSGDVIEMGNLRHQQCRLLYLVS
jgi:hypothetical protein